MQALTTALDVIRALLDESGLALGWKMGAGRHDIWHDETGFARSIPIALGAAITQATRAPGRPRDPAGSAAAGAPVEADVEAGASEGPEGAKPRKARKAR